MTAISQLFCQQWADYRARTTGGREDHDVEIFRSLLEQDLFDDCGDLCVVLFTHFTGAVGFLEDEHVFLFNAVRQVGTTGINEAREQIREARSGLTIQVAQGNVHTQTTATVQTHFTFTLFHLLHPRSVNFDGLIN
ncbi:hypothetical protein D3C73_1338920 [compost metagenome]